MKLATTGLLIELDKITFKAGTYLTAQFELEAGMPIVQRVRSIKHYDKFYRQPPKKNLPEGEVVPPPKKLCELHFHNLAETNKILINKFLIAEHARRGLKKK